MSMSTVMQGLILALCIGFSHLLWADNVQDRINELESADWVVRKNAVDALGEIKDARAVDTLIACLKNPDLNMQQRAVRALGKLGDPKAVEPLIARLGNSLWHVRRAAVDALGKLKDVRAKEALIACANDEDSEVRKSAVAALGELKAVDPLIACLKDKDWNVRLDAVKALDKLKDVKAKEGLIVCLKDECPLVREKAVEALDGLGGYQPITIQEQIRYLVAKNDYLQLRALLGSLTVEPLIGCLKDQSQAEAVRKYSASSLGELGDVRAVEPLIALLDDSSWDVRCAAIGALGKLGDVRAIEPLSALLPAWGESKSIGSVLTKLGWIPKTNAEKVYLWSCSAEGRSNLVAQWQMTKEVLLTDMKSDEPKKVYNATYTFLSIGNEEILPDLIRILAEKGTKEMAEMYLNCGHKRLSQAAEEWCKQHGYRTFFNTEFRAGGVNWGSW